MMITEESEPEEEELPVRKRNKKTVRIAGFSKSNSTDFAFQAGAVTQARRVSQVSFDVSIIISAI